MAQIIAALTASRQSIMTAILLPSTAQAQVDQILQETLARSSKVKGLFAFAARFAHHLIRADVQHRAGGTADGAAS